MAYTNFKTLMTDIEKANLIPKKQTASSEAEVTQFQFANYFEDQKEADSCGEMWTVSQIPRPKYWLWQVIKLDFLLLLPQIFRQITTLRLLSSTRCFDTRRF